MRAACVVASQVTALATRAAAHASLYNPITMSWLLDALRQAGATGQVATLADRAAAHARLNNPDAVAGLLDALRAARGHGAGRRADRAPASGRPVPALLHTRRAPSYKTPAPPTRYSSRSSQTCFGGSM